MFAVAVAAVFNGAAAHQVHRTAKQVGQLFLHVGPIEQGRMRVRPQRRQQVHITFVAKIIAQSRAEQFQPGDAALAAEPAQMFGIEIQFHAPYLPFCANGVKARIAELERQLLEYARKIAERKSGS